MKTKNLLIIVLSFFIWTNLFADGNDVPDKAGYIIEKTGKLDNLNFKKNGYLEEFRQDEEQKADTSYHISYIGILGFDSISCLYLRNGTNKTITAVITGPGFWFDREDFGTKTSVSYIVLGPEEVYKIFSRKGANIYYSSHLATDTEILLERRNRNRMLITNSLDMDMDEVDLNAVTILNSKKEKDLGIFRYTINEIPVKPRIGFFVTEMQRNYFDSIIYAKLGKSKSFGTVNRHKRSNGYIYSMNYAYATYYREGLIHILGKNGEHYIIRIDANEYIFIPNYFYVEKDNSEYSLKELNKLAEDRKDIYCYFDIKDSLLWNKKIKKFKQKLSKMYPNNYSRTKDGKIFKYYFSSKIPNGIEVNKHLGSIYLAWKEIPTASSTGKLFFEYKTGIKLTWKECFVGKEIEDSFLVYSNDIGAAFVMQDHKLIKQLKGKNTIFNFPKGSYILYNLMVLPGNYDVYSRINDRMYCTFIVIPPKEAKLASSK